MDFFRSNSVISMLDHYLFEDLKISPSSKKLTLWLDNCGRENKNNYLFHYLYLLVNKQIFSKISINFMISGHTHNKIDGFEILPFPFFLIVELTDSFFLNSFCKKSNFGAIKKSFHGEEHGGCLEELQERCGKNDKSKWKTKIHVSDAFDNWKCFLENYLQLNLKNFQQYHCFTIEKDDLLARECSQPCSFFLFSLNIGNFVLVYEGSFKKIYSSKIKKQLPEKLEDFGEDMTSCGESTITEKIYEKIDQIKEVLKYCPKCVSFWQRLKDQYEEKMNVVGQGGIAIDENGRMTDNIYHDGNFVEFEEEEHEEPDLVCSEDEDYEPVPKRRKSN